MTAFAAVLTSPERYVHTDLLARLAAALSSRTGRPSTALTAGRCMMMLSPLHVDDPTGPYVHADSNVVVAGQFVIEDAAALREELGLRRGVSPPAIAAAAYLRWQDDFTAHLRGEFAFALWDPRRQTLSCARDGLGVRTLFAARSPGTFIVSNGISGVLGDPAVPHDLDWSHLSSFLASGRGTTTSTAYRAIRVVPEGHTLVVDAADLACSLRRHWWMPAPPIARCATDELLEQYRQTLTSAVSDRLSPEGTAIFLSGGIDSTTIAAAARVAHAGNGLRAYTIHYPRLHSGDELTFARSAADALGLPLEVVTGDQHAPLTANIRGTLPEHLVDEPTLADWQDTLAAAARRSTVALWGEDGDALFMPPGGLQLLRGQGALSTGVSALRYWMQTGTLPYLGIRLRERLRRKRADTPVPPWLTRAAREALDRVGPPVLFGCVPAALPPHRTRAAVQDRLVGSVAHFAMTISPEVTLQRLELRLPLLDTRMLRFVLSVPPVPWCQRKALPRSAYRGMLPDALLDRPKTPLAGFYDALVRDGSARAWTCECDELREYVDTPQWRRTVTDGRVDEVLAAWRVVQLDAWLQRRPLAALPRLCTA